jgi:hypothetical protein
MRRQRTRRTARLPAVAMMIAISWLFVSLSRKKEDIMFLIACYAPPFLMELLSVSYFVLENKDSLLSLVRLNALPIYNAMLVYEKGGSLTNFQHNIFQPNTYFTCCFSLDSTQGRL